MNEAHYNTPEAIIKHRTEATIAARAVERTALDIALNGLGERRRRREEAQRRDSLRELLAISAHDMATLYDPAYEQAANVELDHDCVVAGWYLGNTSSLRRAYITRTGAAAAFDMSRAYYSIIDIEQFNYIDITELTQLTKQLMARYEVGR